MTPDELRDLAHMLLCIRDRTPDPDDARVLGDAADALRQCAEQKPARIIELGRIAHRFADEYEHAEVGPATDDERALLADAIMGLLADDEFAAAIAAPVPQPTEAQREPLSDEQIAEIQRAAYERAAQECLATAAELRRCADGCTDGRYDWKADGALDCADAIRALGRQQ